MGESGIEIESERESPRLNESSRSPDEVMHKAELRKFQDDKAAAASFIKRRWGARLTWTVERAHALNVYSALLSFYCSD